MSGWDECGTQIDFSLEIDKNTGECELSLQVYKGNAKKGNLLATVGLDKTTTTEKKGYPLDMKEYEIKMLREFFF
jgi:hypothetical protein